MIKDLVTTTKLRRSAVQILKGAKLFKNETYEDILLRFYRNDRKASLAELDLMVGEIYEKVRQIRNLYKSNRGAQEALDSVSTALFYKKSVLAKKMKN